jgi:hypothetical protein
MTDNEKEGRFLAESPVDKARLQDPASTAAQEKNQPGREPSGNAQRGTDVHAYISRQLRAVYDDVAKQPVPERFLDLMRQLDAKTDGR